MRCLTPPFLGAGGLLFCLFLSGCSPRETVKAAPVPVLEGNSLAAGVVHRALPTGPNAGIDVIDLDVGTASAHWTVQAHGVVSARGRIVGQANTPREWVTRLGGLAGVNGGYFGRYSDAQDRKDFVGLLVQQGKVRHAAPPLSGQGSTTLPRGPYVRSAFGLTAAGTPEIVWAATRPGRPQVLERYDAPMGQRVSIWHVAQAVGCGPMLWANGKIAVTDSRERLVSPGPLPRTFVAYDAPGGKPAHLIVGMASASDFPALARWIGDYFPRYHTTHAEAAMCLDGGASTQLTYRLRGALYSPRYTGVTVPDALVLLPGR